MLLPNLPPPEEGIRHRQCNTQAFMNQRELGFGTLYIAESRVSWAKDGADEGFSLEYPHIAIHAVSRDVSSFAHPCLYLMVDAKLEETPTNAMSGDGSDSEDDDDESAMTEVRFVPSDHFSLEPMYKALNDCQLLHPDPEDQQSDENVGEEDDEDEGEYEVSENGYHMPGSSEDNMEGAGSEHVVPDGSVGGNEGTNGDTQGEEAMDMGQFDDADM
ncbi:methylosome subunit pICln isoform X2 [Procambarus clarkii]|uniref:methylosome subunit pICln isoform X2 n=1 Tax=Procambarus clarkii TaxID=6728 RepID=UPI001E67297D|nr:methylosome subunit pICln-like isoform X2 [Procambarus clarkii]